MNELRALNANTNRATIEHLFLYKKRANALLGLAMVLDPSIAESIAQRIADVFREPLPPQPGIRSLSHGAILSMVRGRNNDE